VCSLTEILVAKVAHQLFDCIRYRDTGRVIGSRITNNEVETRLNLMFVPKSPAALGNAQAALREAYCAGTVFK
jgi:hypothetical protein